jgi:glucose-6-phosphate 1-dehydrogenase
MPSHQVEPYLFVVFGATGDLMRRKLLPALHRLAAQGVFQEPSVLLGVARGAEMDDEGFRRWAREALREAGGSAAEVHRWCERCVHYQAIGDGAAEDYGGLADRLRTLEQARELPGNRVFYLALPPAALKGLGEAGLSRGGGRGEPAPWRRLVIEKPFGRDLASAQELNRLVHRYFDESQVYRIDHYLGKETVQNVLAFRFANALFESVWNRDRLESVQITVAESLGLEGRAGYYEQAGALRDMVQNHLTQLLTLTAMEVPAAFDAESIRHEKVKVLRSIAPLRPSDAVFGRYARGRLEGREEPGVAPDSTTETFVALRLQIANWRWQGVPFYLRTGKRLARHITQIVATFRCPPVAIFQPFDRCEIRSNAVALTLQPDEGFDLRFEVKAPGQPFTLQTQRLHFRYAEAFGPLPEAYETLLLDILAGDQTLFVRADEVEAAWRLYTPLLQARPPVSPYAAGTWGPPAADHLLAREGERWLTV